MHIQVVHCGFGNFGLPLSYQVAQVAFPAEVASDLGLVACVSLFEVHLLLCVSSTSADSLVSD
jgi:hypothetical protein